MSVENVTGTLLDTYNQLDPSTIQHARDVMNERRTNEVLRRQWFRTADHSMYTSEDGEAILYFAGRDNNLIFQNIDEAVKQLTETNNYKPTKEGIEQVVESAKLGKTLRVKISDLKLETDNDEHGHFNINTKNYDNLNPEQRKFAEKVHGEGKDFVENMKMLKDSRIETTGVYVLNSEYGKEHAKDSPISRASWLGDFDGSSIFDANCGYVVNSNVCLRGVRLGSVAEGDSAQKSVDKYKEAYKTILGNRKNALKSMTPEIATGISKLMTDYLKQKQ